MKHTVAQFLAYVNGWLSSDAIEADELDMNAMKSALNNALIAIDDPSDGIEWFVKAQELSAYRFEGGVVEQFKSDEEAFKYAENWHGDCNASVEKWREGKWVYISDVNKV